MAVEDIFATIGRRKVLLPADKAFAPAIGPEEEHAYVFPTQPAPTIAVFLQAELAGRLEELGWSLRPDFRVFVASPRGGASSPTSQIPFGVEKILKSPRQVWQKADGSSVVVAVLDTGIFGAHPDLFGKRIGYFSVVDNTSQQDCASDSNGHGTMVAGVIAANGGEQGRGIYGVAPACDLLGIKVVKDDGYTTGRWIVAGLHQSACFHANVINVSLAVPHLLDLETAAQDVARNAVTVAAAGNNAGTVEAPARYERVIGVAASDSSNGLIEDWGHGAAIEVLAYGECVESLCSGGGYSTASGTSLATPHIAGLAALVLSEFPGLTPAEVWSQIAATSSNLRPDPESGYGTANGDRAVQGCRVTQTIPYR